MPWLPLICAASMSQDGGAEELRAPIQARGLETAPTDPARGTPAPTEVDGVIIVGRRGAAPIAPQAEFGAADIDAFGADDVGGVIARTLESIGERGAAIILVNGRRVADPAMFYGFPPDALVRVEALPPQAAVLYGVDARRRVLNIVLQQRFTSRDGQLEITQPTAGGMSGLTGDLRLAAIADDRARQAGVRLTRETSLRSDERSDYSGAGLGDESVTLRPQSDTLSANAMRTGVLGDWSTTLGANGRLQEARTMSRLQGQSLARRRTLGSLALSAGLSGQVRAWPVQVGLNAQMSRSDQGGPIGMTATNTALAATLDASRGLAELPAGPLLLNLTAGASRSGSRADFGGERSSRSLTTGDLAVGVNIPLSRATSVGAGARSGRPGPVAVGEASVQLGANLRRAGGDSGAGGTVSLSWAPLQRLRFTGAWSTSAEGVSEAQRLAPVVFGAPILVYDFQTGSAGEVLPILGGDPELRAPRLVQRSAGVSVGPLSAWKIAGAANLERAEATDGVGHLPTPTPQLEAVFPERFGRDETGRLVSIDLRPLNLHALRSEKLSSSLSFAIPLAKEGEGPAGLLRFALNHTWQISNEVILREGLRPLDRLAGDGGGQPGQELSLVLDGRRGSWGGNAAVRWREGYRVRREAGRDGPDDLRVSGLGTVDARLTYRFAARDSWAANAPPHGRNAGIQVEFGIENLFDARPRARLGDGRSAPGYRRDDQDPIGRRARLGFKRRF